MAHLSKCIWVYFPKRELLWFRRVHAFPESKNNRHLGALLLLKLCSISFFPINAYIHVLIQCDILLSNIIAEIKTRAMLNAEIPSASRSVHMQRVVTMKQSGLWSGLGIQRIETIKQLGPWSSLSSYGCYVFSLVASVFTLVVKLGIMKFWLFKFNPKW